MVNPQALETFGKYDKKSLMAGVVVGQGLKGRARAPQTPAPAGFPQGLWDDAAERANNMIASMQGAGQSGGTQTEATPDNWQFDKDAFCFGIAAGRSLEGWELDGGIKFGYSRIVYLIHFDSPCTVTICLDCLNNSFTSIDWGDGTVENYVNGVVHKHTYEIAGIYSVVIVSNKRMFPECGRIGARFGGVYSDAENNPRDILHAACFDGNVSLSPYAFRHCDNLTSVTINNSINSIPLKAFSHCGKLKNVTLGNSVSIIGEGAFEACKSLQNLLIPDSVNTIDYGAFCQCGLTSVTIPADNIKGWFSSYWDGEVYLDAGAFSYCENLKSAIINSRIIGERAFLRSVNLRSVIIATSVTRIDDYAFYDNSSLSDVYYGGTEAQWNAVSIGRFNYALTVATIHYNSTGPDDVHDD